MGERLSSVICKNGPKVFIIDLVLSFLLCYVTFRMQCNNSSNTAIQKSNKEIKTNTARSGSSGRVVNKMEPILTLCVASLRVH